MKNVAKLFLFIMLISCAPTVNYITPTGQTAPYPSYVLQSTSMNLSTTFYYTKFYGIKDVDKSVQLMPKYLDMFKEHDIFLNDQQVIKLEAEVEVYNPDGKRYYIQENIRYFNRYGDGSIDTTGTIKISEMKYRKFEFQLPMNRKFKTVEHTITFMDSKSNIVFVLGPFKYNLIM